ncbi:MAG: HD domain-containing protein [Ruminococcaceae bacterium]|nr:HD domain-containing protein [Oscillospiraceae bacterium]
MLQYEALSETTAKRIAEDTRQGTKPAVAFDEADVVRRSNTERDRANVWRTAFIHDIDKILHCPYYNRYADKTQVFSFYRNDDITRRALHVQLVSRIARTIGKALGLNLDLIEAIALGHDIGHTPFGHAGEKYLDELYHAHTGRHFCHNLHSVRVLDGIYPYNISLQTLSGIVSHDGELELAEYRPRPLSTFEEFDRTVEACYRDKGAVRHLVPSTLEGCVMRISDIIAYLGKDRQDAERAGLIHGEDFSPCAIGKHNAEIINNLIVNIIENSYGHDYIKMDQRHFEALVEAKRENYEKIYLSDQVARVFDPVIRPMMAELYERLLRDLETHRLDSPIFTHHIAYVNRAHYERTVPYDETEPNQLVVDYIASMTDDYFLDLHRHLFPNSTHTVTYYGYFDK